MGFRSSRARTAARSEWESFVANNAHVIRVAGLPHAVTESIACWDDFLRRGTAEIGLDRARFTVDGMSEAQYAGLTQIVDSYFAAGYAYFTPVALRSEERQVLDARYGPPED